MAPTVGWGAGIVNSMTGLTVAGIANGVPVTLRGEVVVMWRGGWSMPYLPHQSAWIITIIHEAGVVSCGHGHIPP